MKKKRVEFVFLIAVMIVNAYHIHAAEEEKKTSFLPLLVTPGVKSGMRKVVSEPSCVLLISLPEAQHFHQKPEIAVESSPFGKRSPRYERLPQSPILSTAGAKVVESSPRLVHSGIKLHPVSSSCKHD